jgi:hypothetical protein
MAAVLIVLVVAALGGISAVLVPELGLDGHTAFATVFFYLFARNEPLMLWVLGAFAALAGVLAMIAKRGGGVGVAEWATDDVSPLRMRWLWMLAALVLATTAAGTWLVFHAYPLSMDEYMAGFGARVIISGHRSAPVPEEWWAHVRVLAPLFSTIYTDHTWGSAYLPVYSAIRALFLAVRIEPITNAALGAVSVVLIGLVGRRLWPTRPVRTWFAVGALVLSAQFLVTSMTAYAMPAHLCLNLLWLWLYLRDDRLSNAIVPWVGVAALGLHNPFPHAVFVAPFLLRTLMRRRVALISYWGGVYAAGSLMWLRFLQTSMAGAAGVEAESTQGGAVAASTFLGSFHLPNRFQGLTHVMNVALLLDWQTPLAALGLVAALCAWRRLSPAMRDVALSLALTFALYIFFPINQGHGWGYRYIYGALGNVALLAAVGVDELGEMLGRERMRLLIAASIVATLAIQLPRRFLDAERFTRPFAAGAAWVAAQDAEVVIVPTRGVWYGNDLVRNDPLFRKRPLVAAMEGITRAEYEQLASKYPGRVRVIRPQELTGAGMIPLDPQGKAADR